MEENKNWKIKSNEKIFSKKSNMQRLSLGGSQAAAFYRVYLLRQLGQDWNGPLLFSYNLYVYTHAQHTKLDSTYLNYSKNNTTIINFVGGY